MSNSSSSCSWESLPKELLEIIVKHLDSRIDILRFRAVSTSWRSLVSLSYRQCQCQLTLNLPPPINTTAILSSFTICRLEDQTPTSACLVKVVESTSGKLHLLNPLILTNPNIKIIPEINNNNNNDEIVFKRSVNMLNFRLIELFKGYTLQVKNSPSRYTLKRVFLFDKVGILVLYDLGKLRYWGFQDKNWTNLGIEGTYYDDLIIYKGQFYVIDSLGIISWIDKCMNLVQYSPPLCGFGHLKNLVVSDGDFYVVDSYLWEEVAEEQVPVIYGDVARFHIRRQRRCRVDMKVYRLDEEWGSWVDVKSLGDRVFVLGKETSFSVSVRDFPGCRGNCIYFLDPNSETQGGKLRRFIGRVFRFDNGSIKTVECFPAYKRLFSPYMNWPFTTSFIP
ncbi:hypothetical protein BVRB_6g142490 [Beta vulgaris subsp. vulgaris]|nr:hypothetical protein BVRB_6g142490 [Beta vulgaris subsp. vulgaris]